MFIASAILMLVAATVRTLVFKLLEDPTLDSVWEKFSNQKDEFGKFIEPQVVPELVKLHVPYALFHCLGVNSWFEHSFPNCVVSFWEV